MPRRTKSVPAYRKHKASGQAVVTLDGRDFYLGIYNSKASKIEYDRLINEWLANGRRLPTNPGDSISVVELVGAFWNHAKSWYRKDGKATDELAAYRVILRYSRSGYGRLSVTEFGPFALRAIRNSMIEKGNSRTYINHEVSRLKRVFRWGVSRELVSQSVVAAIDSVDGLVKGRCDARI